MSSEDTIVAQATPPGRGGVSILRISGPKANIVAQVVLGKLPRPRYASYLLFRGENETIIDKGIALWFPCPNSFTGEDVLELHGHGGPVVIDLLLQRILSIKDIRIAEPGEFSKRAFFNNKIDLTQAEAIADLINASSEHMVRSAFNSLQGTFATRIDQLIREITQLRIYIEAAIDFPDEEINFFSDKTIEIQIDNIITNLNLIYREAHCGHVLKEGIKIVIVGRPNSGKSSLFNALTGRESAIVTDIAGTTRDLLHEHIQVNGMSLHIVDTAGLQNSNDKVESIGIERTWKEIKHADHLLLVVDSTITKSTDPAEIYPDFFTQFPNNLPITLIRNKIDITGEKVNLKNLNNYSIICLSVLTGEGMDILRNFLRKSIHSSIRIEGNFLARRRHLEALKKAENHLVKGKKLLNTFNVEILAEEIRLAQQNLSEITGEFTSNDLLEKIFSSFCIGK